MRVIPSLFGTDSQTKRAEILEYFLSTFDLYEKLFEPIVEDKHFRIAPDAQRHPLIFYFGHTAVFYINKLVLSGVIEERIDAQMEAIFAVGVDEMVWDDLEASHYPWPTVGSTRDYRRRVRERIAALIATAPLTLPIRWEDNFWWVLLMAIEHENIHLETSSVLIRQLDSAYVRPHAQWAIATDASMQTPTNDWVAIAGGTVSMGKAVEADYYSWDNEYGEATVEVAPFEAMRSLISNGEFWAFVEAGGYAQPEWWDEEGAQWLLESKRTYPKFWVARSDGSYAYRAMLEIIDMPYNWAVDVNYHEAKAYCNYLSQKLGQNITLPSEAQWYAIAQQAGVGEVMHEGNIALRHASSCSVDRYRFGELFDVCGNVWQWTSTPIDGYRGFRVHPFYDDFSTPTFDGKHNLIKGGSWISTGNETLLSSRYAFRRHFMQHAGFRPIRGSAVGTTDEVKPLFIDEEIAHLCQRHYGAKAQYPLAMVEYLVGFIEHPSRAHVLELGCEVGRGAFELARHVAQVTALDFTARSIAVSVALQQNGRVEGVDLEAMGVAAHASKVAFFQGDACNLKPHYSDYDAIIATADVLGLYAPQEFLDEIAHRLGLNGVLLLAASAWSTSMTAPIETLCHSIAPSTTIAGLEVRVWRKNSDV